jgi:guanosine-3',5'-bis(diphosphate) 3'-pyrophosphohydrolase
VSYFASLDSELKIYLDEEKIALCYQAYLVAESAHEGQMRRSGEPYITHPVAAALTLAKMRLDYQTIMATLLHDVIEDTPVSKEDLVEKFGADVAELVDGVSKLTQIKFESHAEAQAENFRKMVLAMVKDLRVIIVKLADRLHNMETLGVMPPEKRKRIAIETLEIYAPIANRLGMHKVYTGLEDLGFKALYPMRHRVLSQEVIKFRGRRTEVMQKVQADLRRACENFNVPVKAIFGRQKHLYSIYRKMRQKNASFSEIMDVVGFRLITNDAAHCYLALGALHGTYKPVPLRFKDYIGIPKANGYQSLHSTLFGPSGVPVEVQIRSQEMDKVAENGIAAHWVYKSKDDEISKEQVRAREWVQGLLEMKHGNSLEFIENVKIDLFPDEVYVFTPKGHIMELPKGATPVDFAYMVHSDIGNSCVAAKIDRRLAPLSVALRNGQTVEIITAPGVRPNPAWLNFIVTGKARSNIRFYLKTQKNEESISLGKRLLTKALEEVSATIEQIPDESMAVLLRDLNYKNTDELFKEIGIGNQVSLFIARKLVHWGEDETTDELADTDALAIKGTEGMVVSYAACCLPIPGDPIIGSLESGRGIVVHLDDCRQIDRRRNKAVKLVPLRWDEQVSGEFKAEITVEVANRRGVLAALASSIADAEANIGNIQVDPGDGRHNHVHFSLTVRDRVHLARVMRRIRMNKVVVKLYRNRMGLDGGN